MCLTQTLFLCVGLQHDLSDNMQIIKLLEENKQVVFIFCFYLCKFFFTLTLISTSHIFLRTKQYYYYINSSLSVWKRRPSMMPLWLCITISLMTLTSVMTAIFSFQSAEILDINSCLKQNQFLEALAWQSYCLHSINFIIYNNYFFINWLYKFIIPIFNSCVYRSLYHHYYMCHLRASPNITRNLPQIKK